MNLKMITGEASKFYKLIEVIQFILQTLPIGKEPRKLSATRKRIIQNIVTLSYCDINFRYLALSRNIFKSSRVVMYLNFFC